MGGRILLTGASGQVGGELLRVLAGEVIALGRQEMDLADAAGDFRSLRETIRVVQPRWIVNAAAYTAVDKAESEPALAFAVNRDAVRAMGEVLGRPIEKLNVGLLGNITPQLHAHVVGRRADDRAWPGPVWGVGGAVAYGPDALETTHKAAQKALS